MKLTRCVVLLLGLGLFSSCTTDQYGNTSVDGDAVVTGVALAAIGTAIGFAIADGNKYSHHCSPPPRYYHRPHGRPYGYRH